MQPWTSESNNLVEAIEEGRIVKVTENYAKREGLLILRKSFPKPRQSTQKKQEEPLPPLEDYKRAFYKKSSQVLSELTNNFQWQISKKRRELGISRKQLSLEINESEHTLKLIENGILPKDDFVIINKIQTRLNVNLRKDKQKFDQSPRSLLQKEKIRDDETTEKENKTRKILEADIEIID